MRKSRCRCVACFGVATCCLVIAAMLGCGGTGNGPGPGGSSSTAEIPQFLSVGTAPVGGTFYNIGAAISDVLNDGKDEGGWRQATAEVTGGSLENFRRLDSGDIQLGMANSSITYFAVRGEGGFDKKYELQSVMTLFPLVAEFVAKKGSGIESIADLKGKRVVIGPEGAGFEYFVRPILEAHGVRMEDLDDVYAGMQDSVGYLQDESVAATFLGGGLRSPSISSAATSMDIFLIPYGEKERAELVAKYPSFNEVTVPPGTYRGVDEPFAGLNVGSAHLLVRADVSDEFAYRVTKIIYERREKIAETHASGKEINATNVVRNTGTDFHPGAIRYYTEIGIWPQQAAESAAASDSEGSGSP